MLNEFQERVEAIGEQLRAKINSKFQVSALLAGFAFTILSIQIPSLWTEDRSLVVGVITVSLMIAAIVLYIFSIIRLDELTMPKRFWEEDKDISSTGLSLGGLTVDDLNALKDRMVFYWVKLTLTATWLTTLSLLLLLLPFAKRETNAPNTTGNLLYFGCFIIVLVSSLLYSNWVTKKAETLGNMKRPVD
jgi:hypothetical protein